MKAGVIILIIIIALLLVVIIAGWLIGRYFFNTSLNRKKLKGSGSFKKASSSGKPLTHFGDSCDEWLSEHLSGELHQVSYDGINLTAHICENKENGNRNFVIICHGYTGKALEMGFQAKKFFEKGFSVLLPAARGHKGSEGDYIGMGWPERKDICGWINIINEKYDFPKIVIYGISMGGATVMCTAGENLPDNVICGIEDCGYSTVYDQFVHSLKNLVGVPSFPVMFFAKIYVRLKTGIDIIGKGSSLKQLKQSKLPMLFAHGTADNYVPYRMLDINYEAHPGPKEKVVIEGALHGSCSWDGGEAYWGKIFEFIDKYK